jgi:hypothetical protein
VYIKRICIVFKWYLTRFLRLIILFLILSKFISSDTFIVVTWHESLRNEMPYIFNWSWFVFFSNYLIHLRLSKLRLIYLVMSIFSIANNINCHIFFEFLFVFHWQFNCFEYVFYVFRIDVDNRDLIRFKDVSCVFGGPGVNWTSCISYLIICNYVNSTIYCKIGSFG